MKLRFKSVPNRAAFAAEHKVPGGAAMIYQHITGRRPISLESARAYANGFKVPLSEISPRLAEQVRSAADASTVPFPQVATAKESDAPGYALQPIKTWEYEGGLPSGEYALVPRLEVKLSAGPGSGVSQIEMGFDRGQLRAYSAEWIRRNRFKPNKLRVMKATGRSMEPTVFDGDDLLVNLADTEIVDGKTYALWYEGGERVKRLYRLPGGGLRIRSDNMADFPEIVLGPEYAGHVRIIGRVVDRSGPGGL
ncbi:MAG TPA: S24 family peptidase [Ramlibacter sp.]|nr:S24 family peptidase [Ramlibacter sp.]